MLRCTLLAFAVVASGACASASSARDLNARGARALEQGDVEEARSLFERSNSYQSGGYPEALHNLAIVEMKSGHLDMAKDYCVQALRLSEGRLDVAYNTLGLIYFEEKSYAEARSQFRKALGSLPPDNVEPRYNLCRLDIEEASYLQAVEECRRVVDIDPKHASAYFDLGRALQAAGKPCEARQAWQNCLQVVPTHAECRASLQAILADCPKD